MKNKVSFSGLGIISAIVAGIMTFAAIGFFLKSNLVVIHRGTTDGGLIGGIGVLLIIAVASVLSITTVFLVKKYQKQNEK
ncbi:hypothetical protein SAMN05216490_4935 [Mucilaginibacter mallensis]|uniref:Uncharacterized protein n=1 Tax=Mucilaginibacter mallensis TaxID=652787 RepID=A0A1H2CEB2_MUCMA|nr:hypothetical protein [Mucilaginibacter mallensis]SDT68684.1 hypothetical protein SAMN05216490_4935 [Mucilaginibacter mallensis]